MADSLQEGLDKFYAAQAEAAPAPETCSLVTYKRHTSNALKVHPTQVEEAKAFARSKGVPTEYQPDGRPIITSSRQFRKLARVQGFFHHEY